MLPAPRTTAMMLWMMTIASALALPMLVSWPGRLVYAALLACASTTLIGLAVRDMSRPNYPGSPGDALGLAIVVMFTAMLTAGLLLAALIRVLVISAHRRLRRSAPPGPPPDC